MDVRQIETETGAVPYVPASDFYKKFTYEQLKYAVKHGREFYNKVRDDLCHTLLYNDFLKNNDKKFYNEIKLTMRLEYEQMCGLFGIPEKEDEQLTMQLDLSNGTNINTDNKPALRLVK